MRRDVYVQMFDWSFAAIEAHLPVLIAAGYGGVQVSPPQRSIDRPEWWARYQPIDHTVLDGPLGDEAALRSLIDAAHRCQPSMKVIIDVVLNHMAEDSPERIELRYPRFGPEHFHPRAPIDYDSPESILVGWVGPGATLPDLRTELPYVRAEARRYLQLLIDCGANGFRIDAVKHIEPDYFTEVLAGLGADLLIYGEYISQPGHEELMEAYLPMMHLVDFPLLGSLVEALGIDGDLGAWLQTGSHLPSDRAIAVATTHDVEMEQYVGFTVPPHQRNIAHALMAAGTRPMVVWLDDHLDSFVQACVAFRNQTAGSPTVVVEADVATALLRRGGGWVAVNAGTATATVVVASEVPLRNLVDGSVHTVGQPITIPPHTAALLVPG